MKRVIGVAGIAIAAATVAGAPAAHALTVTTTSQCKRDGWKNVTRADGSAFTSPGSCLAYLQSGR